ncbi:FAD-dependent monooxygenase CTB5 [Pseudocercospora fuligena]|uniref:FAD-dependent monooxygenase CTB5 n=1 Tax=Pseudocercospora fuligena TaxID=685502 RepID=A0A8H6RGB1_9PEZI|nr:FAD-dependent monooxygenase CTB5 [Pseudocercospora fuligena]
MKMFTLPSISRMCSLSCSGKTPMMARNRGILTTAFVFALLAFLLSKFPTSEHKAPAAMSNLKINSTGQTPICISTAVILPGRTYSEHNAVYQNFLGTYWSLNAAESKPSCIVQPSSTEEVSKAVKILKDAFDENEDARCTVRSGGHSPEAGFSSVTNGVVIDMSLFNEILVSQDRSAAVIGVGARWREVYSRLDEEGLAVVGGRNANVGVGGLVLGGGVSFFSPRFGMVCDNIDSYEIVLANSSIVEATAHSHAALWRALKGGTGNFGIVTRVTAKAFLSGKIWAGYAYWPDWQTSKALKAFHDFNKPENFDPFASGPIFAMSYVRDLGVRLTVSSFAYTKPETWPSVFDGFRSIWRLWSTTKIRSLTSATEELDSLAPSGQRQFQVTTTIENDLGTFEKFNEIYTEKLKGTKNVKGAVWSLVFQPLSASVTRKGDPNALGLETRHVNDTLIIALVCVSWKHVKDDELVHRTSREIIDLGKKYAQERGTADPYIYLNYAASGQDVFGGYGEANRDFLREVSKKYDPDGFFQRARQGGFKLDP